MSRLGDEAFWAVMWFAATAEPGGRLSPLKIFYQLLLSFVADDSLEQARVLWPARPPACPPARPPARSP